MSQIFPRRANLIARGSIILVALALAIVLAAGYLIVRSPYRTQVGIVREQPVPYSHKLHVGELGLDCRYCHTAVDKSSAAGIPSTEICMNCHLQVRPDSPALAPIRDSFTTGQPIAWNRIHDLADYVYFNHSIHVNKGFGCVTCHGRVDEMPLMYRERSLLMEWCLDCHRNPARYIRPKDQVYNLAWQPSESQETLGPRLVQEYNVQSKINCSTCHH